MFNYLFNLAIALDQFVNALRGGSPDETLSAAAYRTDIQGKILGEIFRPIIDFIFRPFEENHCHKAYLSEIHKRQLPKEYQVKE